MRLLRPLALALLATACSSTTEPAAGPDLHVTAAAVVASRSDGWLRASIPLVVAGSEAEIASLAPCGIALEQRVGSRWQRVWSPACLTDAAAGDPAVVTRSVTLDVVQDTEVAAGEVWGSGAVDGTYRVVWYGVAPGPFGRQRSVAHVSNGFALRLE
ncbi:MAG TPA: hypothetical protein VFS08_14725 [Gemmatimonadaceae bacterium]|nr:hypothetical protein [Gemmatimonadaceae bacterium]